MVDLESIPTKELIAKAERTPFEKAIVRLGCFLAIPLAVSSWFAVFWFITSDLLPALYLCFLASLIVPGIFWWSLKCLAELRNRRYLRELNRRFCWWSMSACVRYYERRRQPGEIRCVFQGHGLPDGGTDWGTIQFRDGQLPNLAARRSDGSHLGIGSEAWHGVEATDNTISAEQEATIRAFIEKTKGSSKSHLDTHIFDGFPASVAVIFGDGTETTMFSSNLCGLTDEERQDDRIKLLNAVAEVVCDDKRFEPDES